MAESGDIWLVGIKTMIIKLSKQDIERCRQFAETIDTGFYATRNQFNNDKRIKDQIIGKLGELAIFNYFASKDIKISEPDFKIYGKSKKSWDFDLKNADFNIHVKSQSVEQGKRYGISWIFQDQDKHVFKDVSENDYVCFVLVDLANSYADIKSIVKLSDLHTNALFKAPKLAYLTSKKAVYFEDLQISFKSKLFNK